MVIDNSELTYLSETLQGDIPKCRYIEELQWKGYNITTFYTELHIVYVSTHAITTYRG